jgi:CBS domain containing-hemolysin-like protein
LLILDVFITLIYAALQNSRHNELQALATEGKAFARHALALLDARSKLHISYTLSTSLIIAGVSLVATMWLVFPAFRGQSPLSVALADALVLLISFAVLLIGNIVAEAVGSAYSMPILKAFALPYRIVLLILSPVTNLLLWISLLLAKLFGSDRLVNKVTEEEIMTLVTAGQEGGTIEHEEKEMIFSVLRLDETYAREIMVPRIDMQAVDVNSSLRDALEIFIQSGFSRLPVYEETIDNVLGLLYAKDLLTLWKNGGLEGHSVREFVRSAYFVPETRTADALLRDLQARNIHMAIVVDEYGGTAGLVTIENIMEEIVGDIRDEYDIDEEIEYIEAGENEYLIDAGMDVDDLNELLGTDISSDDSDTLGGYIFLTLGRVPIVGEAIDTDDLQMTIRSIDGRRIRKVLVKLKPKPEDKPTPEAPSVTGDTETQLADAQ